MKQGRLGYNSSKDRYVLLASALWIDTGIHFGEGICAGKNTGII